MYVCIIGCETAAKHPFLRVLNEQRSTTMPLYCLFDVEDCMFCENCNASRTPAVYHTCGDRMT